MKKLFSLLLIMSMVTGCAFASEEENDDAILPAPVYLEQEHNNSVASQVLLFPGDPAEPVLTQEEVAKILGDEDAQEIFGDEYVPVVRPVVTHLKFSTTGGKVVTIGVDEEIAHSCKTLHSFIEERKRTIDFSDSEVIHANLNSISFFNIEILKRLVTQKTLNTFNGKVANLRLSTKELISLVQDAHTLELQPYQEHGMIIIDRYVFLQNKLITKLKEECDDLSLIKRRYPQIRQNQALINALPAQREVGEQGESIAPPALASSTEQASLFESRNAQRVLQAATVCVAGYGLYKWLSK